ncbi:MAG: hypothetical protein O3A51_09565 [Verrucomicrobia bacterium]|nr:hypothetical protein [Verrucomicrobiota bacterium]
MTFAYPSQRLQDWLSQQWCICTGRRIDPDACRWLMGPYGNVDVIEDRYVDGLAAADGLVVRKNEAGFGLLPSMDVLNLNADCRTRLRPEIVAFYEHTLHYDLEVWSQWCQFFRPFAGLITRLYSRRLQQLNLPLDPLDTAPGIRSQIYKLTDPSTGEDKHTIWYRHLKSNQHVIYSGIYSYCTLPNGQTCLKVIFPLPRGNATVIMRVEVDAKGALVLVSRGQHFGDPGFYFLLQDARGQHWSRYISTFHESIRVFVDAERVLRADHILYLWGHKALQLHYRINPAPSR